MPKKPLRASSRIVLDAIDNHIAKYGGTQKKIALDAGFDNENYVSMLKNGDRVSLARIPGLKQAMPDLAENLLTATVFSEQFPSEDAQVAIIGLAEYLSEPQSLEKSLLSIAAEIREEDELAGLSVPDKIPGDIRVAIKALLKSAVQRETAAAHDL